MNVSNIEFNESDLFKNRNRLIFSGFVLVIINLYTICTLIFKKQRTVGNYRWFQLDMVVSAFVLFLYITCFWTPLILFPTLGCCTTGLLSFLNYPLISNVAAVKYFFKKII